MPFDFTKLLDVRKVPLWLWAAGTIASGVVLFAPLAWVEALGMSQGRAQYRIWFGGVFMVGGTSLVLHAGRAVYDRMFDYLKRKRRARDLLLALERLTPEEKEILARYVKGDTKTQYLNCTDGVTLSLEHAEIIYRASSLSREGFVFAYNIQPWAWNQLKLRPELLKGAARGRRPDDDDQW